MIVLYSQSSVLIVCLYLSRGPVHVQGVILYTSLHSQLEANHLATGNGHAEIIYIRYINLHFK